MDFIMELETEGKNFDMNVEVSETLKGADGKDGKDGENGADGKDGKDGLSAYEVALKNGFEGSEEEWLNSLHGYDDTEITRRVTDLENTIGRLNDDLEAVLNGN